MALKYPVKINQINNLSDARYCAGMEVELLGISDELNITEFTAVVNWITGINLCLDISKYNSLEEINPYLLAYQFEFVQSSSLEILEKVAVANKIFKVENTSFEDLLNICERYEHHLFAFNILFDDYTPEQITLLAQKHKLILNTKSYNKEQIGAFLGVIKPLYIGLYGGEELAPGLKNFDEIADILEYLEIEN